MLVPLFTTSLWYCCISEPCLSISHWIYRVKWLSRLLWSVQRVSFSVRHATGAKFPISVCVRCFKAFQTKWIRPKSPTTNHSNVNSFCFVTPFWTCSATSLRSQLLAVWLCLPYMSCHKYGTVSSPLENCLSLPHVYTWLSGSSLGVLTQVCASMWLGTRLWHSSVMTRPGHERHVDDSTAHRLSLAIEATLSPVWKTMDWFLTVARRFRKWK